MASLDISQVVNKEIVKAMAKRSCNRYSISVSGVVYDRLRSAIPRGNVTVFVEDAVASALDDPAIRARLVDQCRYEEGAPMCPRSR